MSFDDRNRGNMYTNAATINLKDGTTIPVGSPFSVHWAEYPAGSNHVHAWVDGLDKAFKLSGRTVGRMIAGYMPDVEQLGEWVCDSICETPSGDYVEPDGHSPNGEPSWLLLFGLV